MSKPRQTASATPMALLVCCPGCGREIYGPASGSHYWTLDDALDAVRTGHIVCPEDGFGCGSVLNIPAAVRRLAE